jgi:vacuolar-type H+-ATPase subunit H
MSRPTGDRVAGDQTPHDLVRSLETSIEARLAAANQARDEVAEAHAEAEHVIAQAAAQAAEAGQELRRQILTAARAEASRLTESGARTAADLTAVAAERRERDIAAVVSSVLPQPVDPDPDEMSRP